jgi:hypothetical protein
MWTLEARTAAARGAATVGYVVAVALLVALQEVGLRLKHEERRAWWAGNGRDLLNGVGFASVTAALRGFGFPLPCALFTGATLTLALFGTAIFLERRDRLAQRRLWALLAAATLATPVLVFAPELLRRLGHVAGELFPGH